MHKLIIFSILLFAVSGAWAGDVLEEFLADKIIADYDLDPGLVEIRLVRSSLEIDDLQEFELQAYPATQAQPRGRFPMRVELFRNGELIDKGSASLDVTIYADLPVPVRNIERHEILTAEMFEIKRFDVTSMNEEVLEDSEHLRGCRAKHNLIAGRTVSMSRIEKVPVVEKGTTIAIVGTNPLFEVRAKGMALENGNLGESIRVKNVDSRKILNAEVVAPGTVEITL